MIAPLQIGGGHWARRALATIDPRVGGAVISRSSSTMEINYETTNSIPDHAALRSRRQCANRSRSDDHRQQHQMTAARRLPASARLRQRKLDGDDDQMPPRHLRHDHADHWPIVVNTASPSAALALMCWLLRQPRQPRVSDRRIIAQNRHHRRTDHHQWQIRATLAAASTTISRR